MKQSIEYLKEAYKHELGPTVGELTVNDQTFPERHKAALKALELQAADYEREMIEFTEWVSSKQYAFLPAEGTWVKTSIGAHTFPDRTTESLYQEWEGERDAK